MHSFTIRVYGICIGNKSVLVSDEYIFDRYITKFPGGGMHFGEGTIECLKREMLEETGQAADVLEHFYTTDFFQPSAFDPFVQVLSIYYLINFSEPIRFRASEKAFDFPEAVNEAQAFRWISLNSLQPGDFTLPIDRRVGEKLILRFGNRIKT